MKRILPLLLTLALLALTPATTFSQVVVDASKTGVTRAPYLLCSGSTSLSVTGTTSETTLATCTIPAGAMGTSGGIEVRSSWAYTNSANSKTLRARLGGASGTQFMALVPTSTASLADLRRIRNRSSASSQIGSAGAASSSFGASSASLVTGAVDTTVAVDLVVSGQLGLGSETITLEFYEVWLLP